MGSDDSYEEPFIDWARLQKKSPSKKGISFMSYYEYKYAVSPVWKKPYYKIKISSQRRHVI